MLCGEILGVERRRRWTDEVKISILHEVGQSGWSVADVARRHDLTRQHIYQWRQELRAKGLWPPSGRATSDCAASDRPVFIPLVPASTSLADSDVFPSGGSAEVTVLLRNSRQLRCAVGIDEATLLRLIRIVEAA
ncbi:MAG: IS66-like element accessory protein TnpA [Caulobacterales bacterium]